MKVLVLSNMLPGLLSFRKEVIQAMINEGYEVIISVPDDDRKNELEEMGCNVIPTLIHRRGINPIKDISLFFRYWKIFNRIKPDIILGYTIKPNVYGGLVAQLLHKPFIANITGLGTAVEYPGLLQKITVCMYRLATRKMKCIFFQNDSNFLFFQGHGIATKVKKAILPGSGVNLSRFKPEPYPSPSTTEFIFISRIIKEKGIDDFLYVAQRIKERYGDNVLFHIVGNCEDENYTKRISDFQERGIVIYHGKQKDVRPFVVRTHCTIHPSYYPEGMSNVLLETEAMGHPVITTRRPGCRETVEENITGYLFDEKDKEQLFGTVEKFIALPYEKKKQMGEAARRRVEKLFDRNIVVNKYLAEISR